MKINLVCHDQFNPHIHFISQAIQDRRQVVDLYKAEYSQVIKPDHGTLMRSLAIEVS